MSARELAKSQRRREIVAAARALMRQSSDFAFSMRALAEQAGVSIATPYNLFGSKQAVLVAVLDADLEDYERALARLRGDGIEMLFRAVSLTTSLFEREPEFYGNVISGVYRDGGPEFRSMVSGPRYILWKKLLGQATRAGLIGDDIDPDAFASTVSQLIFAHTLEWAHGSLSLAEMDARNQYGLALTLLGVATSRSRAKVQEHFQSAQERLQAIWRGALLKRLEAGPLDEETRELLKDQLERLAPEVNEELPA